MAKPKTLVRTFDQDHRRQFVEDKFDRRVRLQDKLEQILATYRALCKNDGTYNKSEHIECPTIAFWKGELQKLLVQLRQIISIAKVPFEDKVQPLDGQTLLHKPHYRFRPYEEAGS